MPPAGQPGHRVYDDPASSPCNEFLNGERNRHGTRDRDDADDYSLQSHGVLVLNRAQNDHDWNIFHPICEGDDLFSKVVLLVEGGGRGLIESWKKEERESKQITENGIELQVEELS